MTQNIGVVMVLTETIPPLAESSQPTTRLHLNSPYTFHGEPIASPLVNDMRKQMDSTEFEEQYYYINNTHRPITIMKRDGVAITIDHKHSYTCADFTVRRVMKLKGMALQTAVACLTSMTDLETEELSELKRCLCNVDYKSHSEATVMLDYVITPKDIADKGGTVYHYKLDLLVSTKPTPLTIMHPYSARFRNIGPFGNTTEYKHQEELNVKIRLVDHSPTACKKYINIAGKIFCLTPQKDAPASTITSKINGKRTEKVYNDYLEVFYSAKNDPELVNNFGVGHKRVSIEEAKESMALYDSYTDALNSGDVDMARREKLTQRLHDVEMLKTQNMLEKNRLEKEEMARKEAMAKQRHELEQLQATIAAQAAEQKQSQAALDAKLLQLENDRKILDMQRKAQDEALERERREHQEKINKLREDNEARIKNESLYWKDFYEMRSQVRKDTSDFTRFVPGLLIGVAGIAGAWMKFSSNSQAA